MLTANQGLVQAVRGWLWFAVVVLAVSFVLGTVLRVHWITPALLVIGARAIWTVAAGTRALRRPEARR